VRTPVNPGFRGVRLVGPNRPVLGLFWACFGLFWASVSGVSYLVPLDPGCSGLVTLVNPGFRGAQQGVIDYPGIGPFWGVLGLVCGLCFVGLISGTLGSGVSYLITLEIICEPLNPLCSDMAQIGPFWALFGPFWAYTAHSGVVRLVSGGGGLVSAGGAADSPFAHYGEIWFSCGGS
jgi:hypothetical protein